MLTDLLPCGGAQPSSGETSRLHSVGCACGGIPQSITTGSIALEGASLWSQLRKETPGVGRMLARALSFPPEPARSGGSPWSSRQCCKSVPDNKLNHAAVKSAGSAHSKAIKVTSCVWSQGWDG